MSSTSSATSSAIRQRVILVRLSAIGDIVHTLPMAAALNATGHDVIWAVQPGGKPLLEKNPAVAACVVVPPRSPIRLHAILEARKELRTMHAPIALDAQGLWKSAFWARLSGATRRIGFDAAARREPMSAMFLSERHPLPSGIVHVIDKNLALLQALKVEAIGRRDFPLPSFERESARIDRELAGLGIERPVLLHPGGGWASKLWPVESYGELASRLARRNLPTLVTWGPGEEDLAEKVVAASGGTAIPAPPSTLLELAALAKRARAVVAADTGPLHLACAVGAPAVAIFGPTDPARNGPWNPADLIVSRRPPCFPCHRRDCATHRGFMAEIPVDEVEQALLRRIGMADRELST
ncbi:MAG: glycosyltransferase family 9 protein [Thermoanaerobaculia bacterium]